MTTLATGKRHTGLVSFALCALLACVAAAVAVAAGDLPPGSETFRSLEASPGEKAAVTSQGGATPALQATAGEAGDGLEAVYYDQEGFQSPKVNRVDPNVNFAWGTDAPAPGMGADGFSVRWRGYVEVPQGAGGNWTFYLRHNDGVRMWVDGVKVIDSWQVRNTNAAVEKSAVVNLEDSVRHSVRVDFFERRGNAVARLSWSGPGVAKSGVPRARLYTQDAPVVEPPD